MDKPRPPLALQFLEGGPSVLRCDVMLMIELYSKVLYS
jgi:hypothetical protein